jgi:hypothetical protein
MKPPKGGFRLSGKVFKFCALRQGLGGGGLAQIRYVQASPNPIPSAKQQTGQICFETVSTLLHNTIN